MPIPSPARAALIALVAVASLVSACGPAAPSFSATGPCAADGRAAGAYPQLEALVPRSLDGAAPTTVDSGRTCTEPALGALISHDVRDLRFAGAIWDLGGGSGTTIAVLALPEAALPIAWVEEFYTVGAETARRTERIEKTRPTIAGVPVFRLDTLNDLSFQSVLVWQDGPVARVVLVASPVSAATSRKAHDERVAAAMLVAAGAPPAPASLPPAG